MKITEKSTGTLYGQTDYGFGHITDPDKEVDEYARAAIIDSTTLFSDMLEELEARLPNGIRGKTVTITVEVDDDESA